MDTVMRAMYSKFCTMLQVGIHLHGWQHPCVGRARILKNIHVAVDNMRAWMMKYKGVPLHLPKMMKSNAVELQARIWSQIQNYTYRNSSPTYRHEYSRAWRMSCTHMRFHHLGFSPKRRPRSRSNRSLKRTSTS